MSLHLNGNVAAVEGTALRAYLLGTVDFEEILHLQRRLVYEVAGNRGQGALILCEHAPLVTVGREGSRAHILFDPDEMRSRRLAVRWVNRGGGCLLHLPGQLAVYPILALDRLNLGLSAFLGRFGEVIAGVVEEVGLRAEHRPGEATVRVEDRPVAGFGVAVRDWVSYFGAVLNVNPDLSLFRRVRCGGHDAPMTSLERERRAPVKPPLIRQRLLELLAARFGFDRTSLFFDHPTLRRNTNSNAVATRP